jgi:preprotein translocase subunit SecA/nephrocystin-3
MGQSHKAQQMYEGLLEHTTNEFEKGFMYDQIGWAKEMQGEYKEAIIFLTKSLEIFQKTMPPYHPTLASCYTNMGVAYSGMGEYSKALLSYKKALKIRQQTLCPNHPSLATSYNGIGAMYCKLDEYSKALPFFECALDIGQRSLPSNHPELLGYRKNLDLVKKNL